MRICTKACITLWSKFGKLRNQTAVFIKKFFRHDSFSSHSFNRSRCSGVFHSNRYLMRAERTFNLLSVYNLWTCPSLWCAQNNHRPYRTFQDYYFHVHFSEYALISSITVSIVSAIFLCIVIGSSPSTK